MAAHPRTMARNQAIPQTRWLPLSIAGAICFCVALALGYGGWYLFGTRPGSVAGSKADLVQTPVEQPTPERTDHSGQSQPAGPTPAPAGELPVPGGEVALGGPETGHPLRREVVEPFAIAETEVTNQQYREFIQATGHSAPKNWQDRDFPPGAALDPVTGVTWHDAVEYCKWLSEKVGARVELPTEAEWELAARGPENYKYPWGKEWDRRAAVSSETKGRVRAVKSYEANRSPFKAYDMAGNVWEWVADEARDEDGKVKSKSGASLRIIKGGSAEEPRSFVSATSRYEAAADKSSQTLGFRYVVRRGKDADESSAK